MDQSFKNRNGEGPADIIVPKLLSSLTMGYARKKEKSFSNIRFRGVRKRLAAILESCLRQGSPTTRLWTSTGLWASRHRAREPTKFQKGAHPFSYWSPQQGEGMGGCASEDRCTVGNTAPPRAGHWPKGLIALLICSLLVVLTEYAKLKSQFHDQNMNA